MAVPTPTPWMAPDDHPTHLDAEHVLAVRDDRPSAPDAPPAEGVHVTAYVVGYGRLGVFLVGFGLAFVVAGIWMCATADKD